MFTITGIGVTGELTRCLSTTTVIESPNPIMRRVSARATHYKDADMALRWTAADVPEAERSFKKVRGQQPLKFLVIALRGNHNTIKKAA